MYIDLSLHRLLEGCRSVFYSEKSRSNLDGFKRTDLQNKLFNLSTILLTAAVAAGVFFSSTTAFILFSTVGGILRQVSLAEPPGRDVAIQFLNWPIWMKPSSRPLSSSISSSSQQELAEVTPGTPLPLSNSVSCNRGNKESFLSDWEEILLPGWEECVTPNSGSPDSDSIELP